MAASLSSSEPRVRGVAHGFRRALGLDARALAALRIALALLLLASLASRAGEFTAFYTDVGVLSLADVRSGARFAPWDGVSWLHPFGVLPDPWGSAALFGVAAVAGTSLLLGWRTRASCFLGWLMLTGIDNRNPFVLNGGDDILRLFLFWGLFLPLSRRAALDAATDHPGHETLVVSAGTVAFLVQLATLYWPSALFKSHRDWVTEETALHYALHLEQFVTPLGIALRDHLPTAPLSAATWWIESIGPILLFSPLATGRLRYLLFMVFGAMHAGIALLMGLWLFSSVCIAGWLVTLPPSFWDRVESLFRVRGARASTLFRHERRRPAAGDRPRQLAAGFFLAYVVLWNLWSLDPGANERWFPFGVRWLGYQLRIAQLWAMFSPSPAKQSNWLELRGRTDDGRVFGLRPDGQVCDTCAVTPQRRLGERWRRFHEHILQERGSPLDERYARFLLRRFAASFPGSSHSVSITGVRRPSPPPRGSGPAERPGPERDEVSLLATADSGPAAKR